MRRRGGAEWLEREPTDSKPEVVFISPLVSETFLENVEESSGTTYWKLSGVPPRERAVWRTTHSYRIDHSKRTLSHRSRTKEPSKFLLHKTRTPHTATHDHLPSRQPPFDPRERQALNEVLAYPGA